MIRLRLIVSCVILSGCLAAPTERTNPLDVGAPLDATITGVPDTIRSLLESFTPILETDPALPSAAEVVFSGIGFVTNGGAGFRPVQASYQPQSATIRATIGPTTNPRVIDRTVVVKQRPKRVSFNCQLSCTWSSLGGELEVHNSAVDSLGSPMLAFGWHLVGGTFTIRDTSVVSNIGAGEFSRLYPRSNGSTWLVVSRNSVPPLLDSIPLVVAQVATGAVVNCPVGMLTGQTRQINVLRFIDASGATYTGPPVSITWLNGGPNNPFDPQGVSATVSASGLITANTPGVWFTNAVFTGTSQIAASCQIFIDSPPDP